MKKYKDWILFALICLAAGLLSSQMIYGTIANKDRTYLWILSGIFVVSIGIFVYINRMFDDDNEVPGHIMLTLVDKARKKKLGCISAKLARRGWEV